MSGGPVTNEVLANFFNQQENTLQIEIDDEFFEDAKQFKYLKCLIEVLGSNSAYMDDGEAMSLQKLKEKNSAVRSLFRQRKVVAEVVEEIVKFQHGSLNNSVETMGNVVTEYSKSRADIESMRKSIEDIRIVLTAKKRGQVNLKQLWLKKKEQEERIRILDDIERLADAPRRINQLMQKHCYLSAVNSLNTSVASMFNEDLVTIGGLTAAREELMEQKSRILENIVHQLRDSLLGLQNFEVKEDRPDSIGDSESVDTRSEIGTGSIRSHKTQLSRPQPVPASLASNAGPSTTEWSMDLAEASEELEKSLSPDPRSSGTMFIRLLVRAVGCLGVEDDVERMLLDDAPQKLVQTMRALKQSEINRIGDYSTLPPEAQQELFSEYIHKLLDAIYMSLKKLMYGLQLLRLSRNIRYGGSKGTAVTAANENTKIAVLQISSACSTVLKREFEAHLIEQDVVAMSDVPMVIVEHSVTVEGTLFHSHTGDGEDSAADTAFDKTTVCAPSVLLVAPIYQDIVAFSRRIRKLLIEECSLSDSEIPPSKIVRTVERISQTELLPIIQSHVSRHMNDIQSDTSYFCPPQKGETGANMGGEVYNTDSIKTSERFRLNRVSHITSGNVCVAAVKSLAAVKPLLTYWYQLPQHADAVVTIIDRAIRGFVSCAREQLENLTWKLQAADKTILKKITAGMNVDPFFLEYRRSVYGENCTCLEELLGMREQSFGPPTPVAAVRKSIRSSVTDKDRSGQGSAPASVASGGPSDSLSAGNLSSEMDSWETLWELGVPSYGTAVDKISSDVFGCSTIAAISLGCDWLVREICDTTTAVIRRARMNLKPASLTSEMRGSMQQRSSIRASFSGTLSNTQGDPPAISALITTIHGAVKGLVAVSDMGLATLRGDMEVACFHYLHHLAHVKFSKQSLVTSVNSPVVNNSHGREKETDNVISAFNKQLLFMQDVFANSSTPEAFAVAISPCCYLAPRIFMRCVRFLSGPVSPDGFSRLMKAVVACHQSMSMLLESSELEPSACRRLQDRVTEGFDKVRRYVSFMGAPIKDLEGFMLNSPAEYSYVEYSTMWNLLKEPTKNATFEDAWSAAKAGTTLHK